MFGQYFGQYLLNKGILTAQQLFEAADLQRSVRVKLGVLAINNGIMHANQVEEVHYLQRIQDRKFGEIALEKNYITDTQLDELLDSQRRRQISLSQAIVDKGFLSLTQLEEALDRYKRDNKFSDSQLAALQSTDTDSIVRIMLDLTEYGDDGLVYYDYIALMVRNMLRFLGEDATLSAKRSLPKKIPDWLVSQLIIGNNTVFTAISMNDEVLMETARRFSEEPLTAIDELTRDSVAEFLNLHNGIFIVNMSDKGTELDMTPQKTEHNVPLESGRGCVIPFQLSYGEIQLILSWK
ncbi:MAG TPA: hypothetical protein VN611_07590 [Patescibacteria group bacterium]|nr:hypothetical protein [Patescibacteria group bacterium]